MAKDPRRRVRCLLCGMTPTINNFTGHVKTNHPERIGQPRRPMIAELHEPAPTMLPAVPDRPSAAPSAPPPLSLGVEDVDTIVLAVAEQIADRRGRIPVGALPALFTWRAATSTFLRAVAQDDER